MTLPSSRCRPRGGLQDLDVDGWIKNSSTSHPVEHASLGAHQPSNQYIPSHPIVRGLNCWHVSPLGGCPRYVYGIQVSLLSGLPQYNSHRSLWVHPSHPPAPCHPTIEGGHHPSVMHRSSEARCESYEISFAVVHILHTNAYVVKATVLIQRPNDHGELRAIRPVPVNARAREGSMQEEETANVPRPVSGILYFAQGATIHQT